MKINLKELFFWIFLVLSMSLLLWNVFGNSPSEFIIMAGIIFMLVLKIWSIKILRSIMKRSTILLY